MTEQLEGQIDFSPPPSSQDEDGPSNQRDLVSPLDMSTGASSRKRLHVKASAPYDVRPSCIRRDAIESRHTVEPSSFGAVIITRPFFSQNELDKYRVYTINPGIVKSWVGSPHEESARFNSCVPETHLPDSDVRLLYHVNELRVRIPPMRQRSSTRGSAELTWLEKDSGNEFVIFSNLWGNRP